MWVNYPLPSVAGERGINNVAGLRVKIRMLSAYKIMKL